MQKPDELRGAYAAVLILLYSLVIYGDFTGGMDISLGLARMMGIRLTENFNRPFSARSTEEYWKRWHITMGSWFTDYVFYPLSVSKPMQKLSKWGRAHLGRWLGMRLPVWVATTLTWFLTGLWHGASWNFVVWGLLNGLVILISNELRPAYTAFHRRFPRLTASSAYGGFCALRTLPADGRHPESGLLPRCRRDLPGIRIHIYLARKLARPVLRRGGQPIGAVCPGMGISGTGGTAVLAGRTAGKSRCSGWLLPRGTAGQPPGSAVGGMRSADCGNIDLRQLWIRL